MLNKISLLLLFISSFAISQKTDTIFVQSLSEIEQDGYYLLIKKNDKRSYEVSGKYDGGKFVGEWFISTENITKRLMYDLNGKLQSRYFYNNNGTKQFDSIVYVDNIQPILITTMHYSAGRNISYFALNDNCDYKRFDFLEETEAYNNIKSKLFSIAESWYFHKDSRLIVEWRTFYYENVSFISMKFLLESKNSIQLLMEIDENRLIFLHVKYKKLVKILKKFDVYIDILRLFSFDRLPIGINI